MVHRCVAVLAQECELIADRPILKNVGVCQMRKTPPQYFAHLMLVQRRNDMTISNRMRNVSAHLWRERSRLQPNRLHWLGSRNSGGGRGLADARIFRLQYAAVRGFSSTSRGERYGSYAQAVISCVRT